MPCMVRHVSHFHVQHFQRPQNGPEMADQKRTKTEKSMAGKCLHERLQMNDTA